MLEASSKGTVPVLIDKDGIVIDESLDIMLWAFAKEKNFSYWQSLSDIDKTEALLLIETCDHHFKLCLDRYKYFERYPDAAKQVYRDEAMTHLRDWDKRLRHQDYLLGDLPSLADLAIFPFVRQFAFVDKDWLEGCELSALQKWLAEWLASPLLASVMDKYAQWEPQTTTSSDDSCIVFPKDQYLRQKLRCLGPLFNQLTPHIKLL